MSSPTMIVLLGQLRASKTACPAAARTHPLCRKLHLDTSDRDVSHVYCFQALSASLVILLSWRAFSKISSDSFKARVRNPTQDRPVTSY
jgi:hypothetical protein